MPAFYRMPVVYLAVFLVAGVLGLGARGRNARRVPVPASTRPVAAPIAPAPSDEAGATFAEDGILRTRDGLRRKVVVKDLDVVCRDRPEGGAPVGPPLDYFSIHFLTGVWPEGAAPTMFQIGPRDGPPLGWIASGSVLEWDTRLMARPTPRAGRPALVIYREESCLLDALANRACPKHRGRCPTEGEESETGTSGAVLGLPVLQSRAIPEPDGSSRTIFEVASLVRDRAPPSPPPALPPPDLLPALRRVEIAFVIDTTASMQPTIDAARRLAATLAADAARRGDITLRLALVEFRDDSPRFGFDARIVTRFTDPEGFRAALGRIAAASRGDGSVEEAVRAGLVAALPPAPDEHPARPHLDWPTGRAGELATKMLVLLGDAPDHARDLAPIRTLADRARAAGITIATLALARPGQLSSDERARYQAQWQTLAEWSYRPPDPAAGLARPIAPALWTLDRADALPALLEAKIADRIEHARTLAALAAAEAEGRLQDYMTSRGLTLDRVAPVLVDLHRGEAGAADRARPDPRFRGKKAPSVRRGWISESRGGALLVTLEVLMSHAELVALIDELTALQQAAEGTARNLADLLRIGTAAASGETSFLAADRGTQTFADHLRRRQGLPPSRPDSLLRRTQADLLQADDLYRAALDAKLGACLLGLTRRAREPDWDDPRRMIDGLAPVPFALIDF